MCTLIFVCVSVGTLREETSAGTGREVESKSKSEMKGIMVEAFGQRASNELGNGEPEVQDIVVKNAKSLTATFSENKVTNRGMKRKVAFTIEPISSCSD